MADIHQFGCECGAYACELRNKDPQISPAATPNRVSNRPQVYKFPEAPSWEKGRVMTHENRDGTKIPLRHADGTPVRVKEYAENRHKYDALIRRKAQGEHID